MQDKKMLRSGKARILLKTGHVPTLETEVSLEATI